MTATLNKSRSSYSVLITDDDPGIREAIRDIMEPEGFRTILAGDGEEAIRIVQTETVHLAMFDMHMPRLTGLETWQQLRLVRHEMPGILITADATNDLVRQAFLAHVYSVIPKPITKNVLLYTVIRALEQVYGLTQDRNEIPGGPPD